MTPENKETKPPVEMSREEYFRQISDAEEHYLNTFEKAQKAFGQKARALADRINGIRRTRFEIVEREEEGLRVRFFEKEGGILFYTTETKPPMGFKREER